MSSPLSAYHTRPHPHPHPHPRPHPHPHPHPPPHPHPHPHPIPIPTPIPEQVGALATLGLVTQLTSSRLSLTGEVEREGKLVVRGTSLCRMVALLSHSSAAMFGVALVAPLAASEGGSQPTEARLDEDAAGDERAEADESGVGDDVPRDQQQMAAACSDMCAQLAALQPDPEAALAGVRAALPAGLPPALLGYRGFGLLGLPPLEEQAPCIPLHLPYIYTISPLHLPYGSPTSPLYLPPRRAGAAADTPLGNTPAAARSAGPAARQHGAAACQHGARQHGAAERGALRCGGGGGRAAIARTYRARWRGGRREGVGLRRAPGRGRRAGEHGQGRYTRKRARRHESARA